MYSIEVSQLLHTVAIGTPLSSAKVIQVWRNEYQVRIFPGSISALRWLLDSSADQIVNPAA